MNGVTPDLGDAPDERHDVRHAERYDAENSKPWPWPD
jgi:hypothetical protein